VPVDQFRSPFDSATLEAKGTITWPNAQVDLLCAWIVQVDAEGRIRAVAYGAAEGNQIAIRDDPGGKHTWNLTLRRMPRTPKFDTAQRATGLAFYKRKGGYLEAWVTRGIRVT
jgi:hypothetical protein